MSKKYIYSLGKPFIQLSSGCDLICTKFVFLSASLLNLKQWVTFEIFGVGVELFHLSVSASFSVYCLAVLSNISNPTMRTGLDFKSAPENVFLLMYIFRFIVLLLWTKKIMLLVWCHCLISYKYWSYIPQVWPAELPFFSNLVYMSSTAKFTGFLRICCWIFCLQSWFSFLLHLFIYICSMRISTVTRLQLFPEIRCRNG